MRNLYYNVSVELQLPVVIRYPHTSRMLSLGGFLKRSAFWVLFYVMEAGAIMTILTQHGGDKKAAVRHFFLFRALGHLALLLLCISEGCSSALMQCADIMRKN